MSKILTNSDGTVKLELKDDRLSAWLTIDNPHQMTNEKDILDLIEQAGVKSGFEEAEKYMRLQNLEKEQGVPFPIALCNPVQGDARLHYHFDLDSALNFSGVVKPEELAGHACLEAGTVLAEYTSNIFDRRGSIYDIYGEMLQVNELSEDTLQQIVGEHLRYDAVTHRFISCSAGYPKLDQSGRISVLTSLTIQGDILGLDEGLHTPAGLRVEGDVVDSNIYVGGSLQVSGMLVNSGIECCGDLEVGKLIRDCRVTKIEVQGDISCLGIEHSKLLCRGRINFKQTANFSEIYADGGLRSEEGLIFSGHIESGSSIEVSELGDPGGEETELELTVSPYHKALLLQLTRELILKKQQSRQDQEDLAQLNARIDSCETQIDRELEEYLKGERRGRLSLKVSRHVHPPLRIRIMKNEYSITEAQEGLELVDKE